MYVNSIRLYTLLLHLIHTTTKIHSYDLEISNEITVTHCQCRTLSHVIRIVLLRIILPLTSIIHNHIIHFY